MYIYTYIYIYTHTHIHTIYPYTHHFTLQDLYLTDLQLMEKLGIVKKGTVVAADNVVYPGAPGYLEYVQGGGTYDTHLVSAQFEYDQKWRQVMVLYVCVCVCVYACVCVCVLYVCVCIYIYIYIHTCSKHMLECDGSLRTYMHVFYMHTNQNIHTYTHTCIQAGLDIQGRCSFFFRQAVLIENSNLYLIIRIQICT
jgi:hypothetical protein